MTKVVEILLSSIAACLLVPATVLFVEVCASLGYRAPRRAPSTSGRVRIAVLVPAHNEESGITDTLRCIKPQLLASDRLLVVADNCVDLTARVAADEGAWTVERTDSARRGKGYALDYGIRRLESDPPEVVVIIDADCRPAPGAIERLARLSGASGRPVQALYLMSAPPSAPIGTRLSEFAWILKNHVRPLGLHRLGLPCQLMGTGMAFPWTSLVGAPLATGHIVEDLKLGIDLARSGLPPLFCPEAFVSSRFPTGSGALKSQRTRWEHGYLGVILSDAPRLLWLGVTRRKLDLLAMAADLAVPPVALLSMQIAAIWALAVLVAVTMHRSIPLAIASFAVIVLLLSILLCWAFYGRRTLSLPDLLLSASYALRKIPLYAKFLVSREGNWIRSKRDKE